MPVTVADGRSACQPRVTRRWRADPADGSAAAASSSTRCRVRPRRRTDGGRSPSISWV